MPASPANPTAPVLTAAGRARVQERLQRARETLDRLAELSELTTDQEVERQRALDQVEELTRLLERAADVAAVDEDPTIVEVGDEVDVRDEDGEVTTYALVHPAEASAREGRVSIESPLGRALLGARPGDTVTVHAPGGAYRCTILARRRLS
ncbi:MAG TPA: GreA/GreB family elongation factor [Egibacteraceae bacterium]